MKFRWSYMSVDDYNDVVSMLYTHDWSPEEDEGWSPQEGEETFASDVAGAAPNDGRFSNMAVRR